MRLTAQDHHGSLATFPSRRASITNSLGMRIDPEIGSLDRWRRAQDAVAVGQKPNRRWANLIKRSRREGRHDEQRLRAARTVCH
jgi:hypothetical protein